MRTGNYLKLAIILLTAIISASSIQADTYVSGNQFGTWTYEGSPYIVIGDITVPPNRSLNIQPGVHVLFRGTHRILVDSSFIFAIGTVDDSIYFQPEPGVDRWGSIHIFNTPFSKNCNFKYCLFKNADGAPEDDRWGGAFYTVHGRIIYDHCLFFNNRAYTGSAIFGHLSTVIFQYCEMYQNRCDWKGGVINFNTCTVDLIYSALCRNHAHDEAGGIYAWMGDIDVVNCTIAFNTSSNGGGIFNYPGGSTLDIKNTILYYNDIGNITGPGWSNVTYTDIGGGWTGAGNIDENPLFINPGINNYHLLPNSPCIDAGDPESPPDPDGTPADMGAFPFDQSQPQGHLTLDIEPINPPIVIPSQGGSFQYTATARCDNTCWVIFGGWTELRLPSGYLMGPLVTKTGLYLDAGDSLVVVLEFYLSAIAMPGTYTLIMKLGDPPNVVLATDSFTFEKSAQAGSPLKEYSGYVRFTGWDQAEQYDLPTVSTALPSELSLRNSPNPFNPQTVISFTLPQASLTKLAVYDVSGREFATLINGFRDAGKHDVTFDGSNLPSGIYLYRLTAGVQTVVGKMALVK
ncbi:MAG: T9SS type A sorting domain-containing protein [bacterium]|nr:T9SS type A sorting domain-containing protein [bacterium]